MDDVKIILFFVCLFYSAYKSINIIRESIKWFFERRRDLNAVGKFKHDQEACGHLSECQSKVVERLLRREAFSEKKNFRRNLLGCEIYSIYNPTISIKDWLKSNSDLTVMNKVNEFEAFFPGIVTHVYNRERPDVFSNVKEMKVVFYDDVAVLIEIPGVFYLFEEKEEDLFIDCNLKVKKTPVSYRYEVDAEYFDTSINADSDGWSMWEVGDSKLLVYPRNPGIDAVVLLVGVVGFLSFLISGIFHLVSREFFEVGLFKLMWPALWFSGIVLFVYYEVLSVNGESVLIFDRENKNVKIKSPETGFVNLPWERTWLKFENEFGWLTGTVYTVSESNVFVYDKINRDDPLVSMAMPYFQSSFSVWKLISCFISGRHEVYDIFCGKVSKRLGFNVFVLGIKDLYGKIVNSYMRKGFLCGTYWVFLSIVTLGPIPYWVLMVITQMRTRQALRNCAGE